LRIRWDVAEMVICNMTPLLPWLRHRHYDFPEACQNSEQKERITAFAALVRNIIAIEE